MEGCLISPDLSEIRRISGDNLNDAIEGFWSSEWCQGWNPDQRILDTFGEWVIYQKVEAGILEPVEALKDCFAIERFFQS